MPPLYVIIGVIGILASLTSGYIAYNAGFEKSENKYLALQQEAADDLQDQINKNAENELLLAQERAKKQEVVTKVVTRVKREIVNLPARDCGWTNDERLRVQETYCASFPSAPSCVPDSLPDSSRTPTS